MEMRPVRVPDCHSDRPHYAKGLCKSCYDSTPERRAYRQARRADPAARARENEEMREFKRKRREDPEYRNAENARERQRRADSPEFHERARKYMQARRLDPEFRRRASENARRARIALKAEMIAAYGGGCSCCGEREPGFLTLEHLNGDGKTHRAEVGVTERMLQHLKRRGWPKDGYTVLCFNCNLGKAINGGVCPHDAAIRSLLSSSL